MSSLRLYSRVTAVVVLATVWWVPVGAAHAAKLVSSTQFGHATYSVGEADSTVSIDVTRTSTKGKASVLFSTANGTAVAGTDYGGVSGLAVSFAPGEASKQVTVTMLSDGVAGNANKTFSVLLTQPKGTTLGSPSTAAVTILNPPKLAMSIPPGTSFAPPGTVGVVDNYVFVGDTRNYTYGSIVVTATDGQGNTVTGFTGTVSLTSSADCQAVVNGGSSYTYTPSDTGTHTFGVAFGTTSAFGTPGSAGSSLSSKDCTVTAHEQTSAYLDDGSTVTVQPGEYCDGLDNNANGVIDEFYPQLGQAVTFLQGGTLVNGRWVCGPDLVNVVPAA